MPVLAFYNETRERFPELTAKADWEHIKYWGELDQEFAYSWFESLAKALNEEMSRNIPAKKYAANNGQKLLYVGEKGVYASYTQ